MELKTLVRVLCCMCCGTLCEANLKLCIEKKKLCTGTPRAMMVNLRAFHDMNSPHMPQVHHHCPRASTKSI